MTGTRVLVTGIGMVSPLASDAQQHFQRLLRGESGVRVTTRPEYARYPCRLEGRVTDCDPRAQLTNRMLRKVLSPAATYSVAAAGEAISDAGLKPGDPALQDCGLYIGSIAVEINPDLFIPAYRGSLDRQGVFDLSRFAMYGMKLLDPLLVVKSLPNAGVCAISVEHGVLGANVNVTNGTVSGLHAVAFAVAAIERGETDMAIAGGYDSLLRMDCIAEHIIDDRLSRRQVDPARACRPFSWDRDGYAVGEGAAFVFLESESRARARSAPIYGEILAVGHATDASLMHQPSATDGRALEQAARHVLCRAGCAPTDLGLILGDGLAVEADDLREANVNRRLVGRATVPFTAATPALGFTGAASGAFSLAHALMALRHQVIPPLLNRFQPDPRCAIHAVEQAEARLYRRALVWNSDRGRKNVAVLVGSYKS